MIIVFRSFEDGQDCDHHPDGEGGELFLNRIVWVEPSRNFNTARQVSGNAGNETEVNKMHESTLNDTELVI